MTGPTHSHPNEHRLDMTWVEHGACRSSDVNVFFPPGKDRNRPANCYDHAKTICARCPVTEPCLNYALVTGQTDGVWGGLSPSQRHQMRARYMEARRVCVDCQQPTGRGPNAQRCDTCHATHRRHYQNAHRSNNRFPTQPDGYTR